MYLIVLPYNDIGDACNLRFVFNFYRLVQRDFKMENYLLVLQCNAIGYTGNILKFLCLIVT